MCYFFSFSTVDTPNCQSTKKKRFIDGYNQRASTEVDEVEKYFTDEAIDIDVLDHFPNIRMVYR